MGPLAYLWKGCIRELLKKPQYLDNLDATDPLGERLTQKVNPTYEKDRIARYPEVTKKHTPVLENDMDCGETPPDSLYD